MIYVRTEDSKDGMRICEKVCKIYGNGKQIKVESFNGISNLKEEIEQMSKFISPDDTVYLVYDMVTENPRVASCVYAAKKLLKKLPCGKQFKTIPTISFELEILMIHGIEYFANPWVYYKYIANLRDIYYKEYDTKLLTEYTKENELYKDMYDRIRQEKIKKQSTKNIRRVYVESYITIETLAKRLLNEVFEGQPIDKPLTTCWMEACCYRTHECKKLLIDIGKIKAGQKNDPNIKVNMLISNTSYKKLGNELSGGTSIKQYNIADFVLKGVDRQSLEAFYVHSRINSQI